MSTPISSTEELLQALKEHPEWRAKVLEALLSGSGEFLRKLLQEDPSLREELRKEILTEDLLRLPAKFEAAEQAILELLHQSEEARHRDSQAVWEAIGRLTAAQERTEQHLAQLTERVDRTQEQLAQLTERVDRTQEQLGELTERVDRLTETVDWLGKRVDRMEQQLGQHRGRHLEDAICDRPWNYLGSVAKKTKALALEDVKEMLRGVSEEDLRQLDRMDACIEGKYEGRSVLLAVEASAKLESYDLERARLWATILSLGLRGSGRYEAVLPVVVGYEAEEPLLQEAKRSRVWAVIAKELVVRGREVLAQ
jgi:phage shock protein A/uncharacterized coiled-coil protein SlyX